MSGPARSARRLVLFGTGTVYQNLKHVAFRKDVVVALADNSPAKQGMVIDGVPVIAPGRIPSAGCDLVVLMLSFVAAAEVKAQLSALGVPPGKILFHDEYVSLRCAGERTVHPPAPALRVALVTHDLGYHGSSVAIVNAARALVRLRWSVTLVAPRADDGLVREANGFGVKVVVWPAFLCMGARELDWIRRFDFAVVNVFPMIDCAVKVSRAMPMLWWLHEPSGRHCAIYRSTLARHPGYMDGGSVARIPVFAVSGVALRAFREHFPAVRAGILPYCVPDEAGARAAPAERNGRVTFALVAGFSELKQQALFLRAASRLGGRRARFLLIGKAGESPYAREALSLAASVPGAEVRGVLTRAEMAAAYRDEIDVVVCPSLEETMSLTVTEGMMHSKVCIASDGTGMAEHIADGANGFICRAGDELSLREKMEYVAGHFGELSGMRERARKTYEENFSMDAFGRRIDGIIRGIMRNGGGYGSIV